MTGIFGGCYKIIKNFFALDRMVAVVVSVVVFYPFKLLRWLYIRVNVNLHFLLPIICLDIDVFYMDRFEQMRKYL